MASHRQIAANRLNALRSTGPRTFAGKLRSRRNAVRHGLTAETVVGVLEDARAYRAFEKTILSDQVPRSELERHLLVRMVSLLWRLRRATAIESGLLQIQGGIMREREQWISRLDQSNAGKGAVVRNGRITGLATDNILHSPTQNALELNDTEEQGDNAKIARCFIGLANRQGELLARLASYEGRLWRQLLRTSSVLKSLR